ncbi:response regulator [Thiolinea disciformis]|uniref:response regulator n=1 Tax=Thiolinea disciformis TaxID=125614 RepID=UPI000365B57D|nr:response regulator transcription factor [Thiolinea disciformis]
MTQAPFRVFLVEDDQGTLHRMAEIVRANPEWNLCGMAANYSDAAQWLELHELDVLLTDLGLPDGNGKQLIEQTRAQHPKAEIMVISRFGDENSVVEAIKAGASGYLLKDESPEHIASAIQQLLQGGSPISPAIARYILDYFQHGETAVSDVPSNEAVDNDALLTPKEKMVLQYISRGYSNKEIARALEISPHTVASHIKRIYQKLAVNSRNEAVFEGWRMGQLSMRQQTQSSSATASQKDPRQIAQALREAGKSVGDTLEIVQVVFSLNADQTLQVLMQSGFGANDLFGVGRAQLGLDDKTLIQKLLALGFTHEQALQAMLAQL